MFLCKIQKWLDSAVRELLLNKGEQERKRKVTGTERHSDTTTYSNHLPSDGTEMSFSRCGV